MPNLLGMHDVGGVSHMAASPGWVCLSEAIGADPWDQTGIDYRPLSHAGLGVIVRLNHGYGPGLDAQGNPVPGSGTIPLPSHYADFAERVANFVRASAGCTRWIIGNEPNHSQERPQGTAIYPNEYADCYRQCRDAIHAVPGHEQDEVLVAAIAPWDATTKYAGNEQGDWIQYFFEILTGLDATGCDGLAIHAYTHGMEPGLITSTATMQGEAWVTGYYWHFLIYQDWLAAIPPALRGVPVYLTETDNCDGPWSDVNDGWIQRAVMEIDAWNRTDGTQKILCLCCYRWSGDQWALEGKQNRLADFAAALSLGIESPASGTPSGPQPPEPPDPAPVLAWDTRLTARGVVLTPAQAQPGAQVWRVVEGRWFDEAESQGRHHTFVDAQDEQGNRVMGTVLHWGWSDVTTQKVAENKSDPWLTANGIDGCAVDFPMEHTAPTYWCAPEGLSDRVEGLGLGDLERPGMTIHTSYYFRWQFVTEPDRVQPPDPGPIPPADDKFDRSLAFTLKWEGGYQNDPNDLGNWTGCQVGVGECKGTNFGISACSYPDLDIVNLTEQEAAQIYEHDYWGPSGAAVQPWPQCVALFDTSVLHGVGAATSWWDEESGNPYGFVGRRLESYTQSDNWGLYGLAWTRRVSDLLAEMAT